MGGIYRDPAIGWRRRLAALITRRQAELEDLPPCIERIYVNRVARTTAGLAAFAGMTTVFTISVLSLLDGSDAVNGDHVGIVTMAVWVVALATYVASRPVASAMFRRRAQRLLHLSGDLHRDLDLLAHSTVASRAAVWLTRLERSSAAWPLMGTSLAAPLFLHWVMYGLHMGAPAGPSELGTWVLLSTVLVGHCHYVLAHCGWRFARDLSRSSIAEMMSLDARGLRALSVTTASSLITGLVLMGIPSLIVVLTGLMFVPASYWMVLTTVRRERRLLNKLTLTEIQTR